MTTTHTANGIQPTNVLSTEELAPLMERKRQLQANLASQSLSQSKSGCSSGGCGGGQSSCGSSSAAPSPAIGQEPNVPNVPKALLIAISILGVAALAWWGVAA